MGQERGRQVRQPTGAAGAIHHLLKAWSWVWLWLGWQSGWC